MLASKIAPSDLLRPEAESTVTPLYKLWSHRYLACDLRSSTLVYSRSCPHKESFSSRHLYVLVFLQVRHLKSSFGLAVTLLIVLSLTCFSLQRCYKIPLQRCYKIPGQRHLLRLILKMARRLTAEEKGELDTYEVTRSTARVRVVVDGLKPLIMEAAMDYASGEESIISLDYENLGNHCSVCYRLSHLQSQCPERPKTGVTKQTDIITSRPARRQRSPLSPPPETWESDAPIASFTKPFQQHLDRYGRPFGDRVSTAVLRPPGPRNKIAPVSLQRQQLRTNHENRPTGELNQDEYSSPPYMRRRLNHEDRHGEENTRERNHRSPTLQWRAKTPILEQEVTPPSAPCHPPRQSVGRNLEATNFQSIPEAPSREEVIDDLMVATRQYLNCPDPKEAAARKERVLLSEINGDVEEAATRILQNSIALTRAETTAATEPLITEPVITETQSPEPQENTTAETSAAPTRKRGRPPKDRQKRTTVRLSPKTYAGMGSKKRNIARHQGSPGTSSRAGSRAAIHQTPRQTQTTSSSTVPPIREEEHDSKLQLRHQYAITEHLEKDQDDESLRKWKEQLLGIVLMSPFTNIGETLDPKVGILSLAILSLGRPDSVLMVPQNGNPKGMWFTLK
ncbi:hypothetical protein Bca101_018804 [Brassica carinata]